MANVTLNQSNWTRLCWGLPTIGFHACLTVVNVSNSVRGQVKALYTPDGSIQLMSDLDVSYLEQNDLIIISGIIPK